jgi:hypothetical protein
VTNLPRNQTRFSQKIQSTTKMTLVNTLSVAVIASLAISASTSHAATILPITLDAANSYTGGFSALADTVNDPFSYNPDSPTSPAPVQGSDSSVTGGWHGNLGSGQHLISYLVTGGITTSNATSSVFFDFYGRTNIGNPANVNILVRDNDYTVTLFNGNYTTQVAQLTGQSVADAAPYFNRSTFNLGAGVTFDRIQLTSAITAPAGETPFFTVMEVRAATVPETSSALLCGLGALGLLRRRRLS